MNIDTRLRTAWAIAETIAEIEDDVVMILRACLTSEAPDTHAVLIVVAAVLMTVTPEAQPAAMALLVDIERPTTDVTLAAMAITCGIVLVIETAPAHAAATIFPTERRIDTLVAEPL